MFNLTCCVGCTGGDFHLPVKGVRQESLAKATEQNVGLKEFNTPEDNALIANPALPHLVPVPTINMQPKLGF